MSDPRGRPKDRELPLGGVKQGIRGALLRARATVRLCKAGPRARSARGLTSRDPRGRPKDRELPLGGVKQGIRGALLRARATVRLCKAGPRARSARGHL